MSTNLVGQNLGGYDLVEAIGAGAMATVYKAFQPTLERWVAIKVLHYKESSAMIRFRREARAIALLRHKNILMVYEYGEERGWPYIVMEYVEGGALSDRLSKQPLPWQTVVKLAIPVAEALEHAHQHDIIHRDVKPSNILLPKPDWPLLADFGLVKLPSLKEQEELTRKGMSMGTPAYVAPEQARGITVDARVDMYSLGVVMFEMAAGRLPFNYSNPNRMLLAHISETLPPLGEFNPSCPPPLQEIVGRAMAKQPEDRYPDMGHLITALSNLVAAGNNTSPDLPPPKVRSETRETVYLKPNSSPTSTTAPSPQPPPVALSALKARLLLPEKNASFELSPDRQSLTLGRTHRNTVADIDLGPYGAAQMGVSRHHARLIQSDNGWQIADLGSLNGTFVNDIKVQPNQPVLLKNGDVLRFSHLSMVFLTSA